MNLIDRHRQFIDAESIASQVSLVGTAGDELSSPSVRRQVSLKE